MLTRRQLVKAGRLMEAHGELRAGPLEHEAANLVGPSSRPYWSGQRCAAPADVAAAAADDGPEFSSQYDRATGRLIIRIGN